MPRKPITAVLSTYNRDAEVREVEDHLRATGFFADVIVWRNSPDDNRMVYGRYLAAAQARTEWIYTQDDDCIVENIEELLDAFDGDRLVSAMKPSAVRRYENAQVGEARVTLLGWGSVFHREWIGVLDRYVERYGRDGLLLREADRIFTLLLGRGHTAVPARVREFPCALDERALSMQPEHWDCLYEAMERTRRLLSRAR